ncbi:hypothetical protein [Actinophytocola sp.]|uniref:hypothetical protein n=1 Tax=Actinophytocola sp. TaxID=1872138 RepID=UPI002D7EE20F|nr:hypothetical protein [Actinophytocola sp.]HET9144244.1 hypothetical protein [Actinophytocola sp.]HEU5109370.1 hypothetical protein [Micromonosporaceae bacterium]
MKALDYVRAEDQLPEQARPPGGALGSSALVGTWFATDKQALGVVRLELRQRGETLFVRAYGADSGEPYDWGEIEATAYGAAVTAADAMAFSAVYDFGFLVTILAAYAKQGILVLDTFNTFTDSSGRSNYFSREFFHR